MNLCLFSSHQQVWMMLYIYICYLKMLTFSSTGTRLSAFEARPYPNATVADLQGFVMFIVPGSRNIAHSPLYTLQVSSRVHTAHSEREK